MVGCGKCPACQVTPCMGVWIETSISNVSPSIFASHPVWVCGLKHQYGFYTRYNEESHPVWVCGLKHIVPVS